MVKTLLVFLSACAYDASYGDCAIHCATDTSCPEGLVCGDEGLCRVPGMTEMCAALPSSSCDGLAPTCGPAGTADCCESPLVTGGTFYRSYDVSGDGMYSSTSYPATVSNFRLDKYEVTVGRFRQFVKAGQGTRLSPPAADAGAHARIMDSGWDTSWNGDLTADAATLLSAVKCRAGYQTWTDAAGANESLPMNCVTWYEAMAFCIWDGGYPPTEAEWNYAAAGGSEQRAYPWSSPPGALVIDCSYANYDPSTGYCTNATGGSANRVGSESPRGDGRWRQSDIAGNMFEWVLDWYADPYPTTTCDDCANLTLGTLRVIRGGGFNSDAPTLRTGRHLVVDPPTTRFINVGFRCARAP
jgi:sulfatase modifying factor 1